MKYYDLDLNTVKKNVIYYRDKFIYVPSYRLELNYDIRDIIEQGVFFLQLFKYVEGGEKIFTLKSKYGTIPAAPLASHESVFLDNTNTYFKVTQPLFLYSDVDRDKTFLMECVFSNNRLVVSKIIYDVTNKKMYSYPDWATK